MVSDVEMESVDPQSAVERLILASAPEKERELKRLWEVYGTQFSLLEDKPGFSLEAGPFGLVLFTNRTMLQIWLLGFAAWKALYSYGGLLVLINTATKAFETDQLSPLVGQAEADQQFAALIDKVRELHRIDDIAGFDWPRDIPHPNLGKPEHVEGAVVFDLLCLAGAYVFLHEVQHVIFRSDGTGPSDPALEELECDRFARHLLLDSIDAYSTMTGFPAEKVRSKRAMAIALGSFLLLVFTPPELWSGSRSHPPISQRIQELAAFLPLGPSDSFWIYLSCLVLSHLRVEGRLPRRLEGTNPRDLCLNLLALVGNP